MISSLKLQDFQHLRQGNMANFNTRIDVGESAHGAAPVGFETDVRSATASIAQSALSLGSRLAQAFRALRQRERDRVELARMWHSELHDLRMSSSDRYAEISKPFWRE